MLMLYPSRIFTAALLLFLIANVFALIFRINLFSYLYFVLPFILVIFFWKKRKIRHILILLTFFAFGLWRTVSYSGNYNFQIPDGEKEVALRGMISEETKISGTSQSIIFLPESSRDGQIEIITSQFPKYNFGENISVSGKLSPLNPSDKYSNYLRVKQIFGIMKYPKINIIELTNHNKITTLYQYIRKNLIGWRLNLEQVYSRILPEPQAGLLSGILLGSRADLTPETLNFLARTGTTHIIALSGYNITIVAMFTAIIFKNRSRRLSFWFPVLAIFAFVLATGFSASVIRAAIMGTLLLLANSTGRQPNALISILFASAVMVFLNPFILVYDVGFQLSFAAVSGILFLVPVIEKYFLFLGKTLGSIIAATLSAQVFTWPIISVYFGTLSIISPLANLLILPLVPPLMFIGFLTGVAGLISLWLSQQLSFVIWLALTYIIKIIGTLGELNWASANYQIKNFYIIIGYYLLLFDLALIKIRGTNIYAKRKTSI